MVTLIGVTVSQNLLSLLQGYQGQPRLLQLRRNAAPRAVRAQASSSASASSSLGLGRITLDDLLSRSGLFASLQPRIARRRTHRLTRPRTIIVDQRVPASIQSAVPTNIQSGVPSVSAVPGPVPAGVQVAGLPAQGIPAAAGVGTTMLFDTPDPNTPDTPDLIYAPRSMMGDMQQVEALRNRAEADGVVFV